MTNLSVDQATDSIKNYINANCIFVADNARQYCKDLPPGRLYGKQPGTTNTYLFTLRNLTHNPVQLQHTAVLLYKQIIDTIKPHVVGNSLSIQLAGVETASLPLITAISLVGLKAGVVINTFSVRKERKRYGLHNYIDGMPNQQPVVIIDDLINSGGTLYHCQQVVKHELGLPANSNAFCIVKFAQTDIVDCGPDSKVSVKSLFTADQFDLTKGYSTAPADCSRLINKRPDYM